MSHRERLVAFWIVSSATVLACTTDHGSSGAADSGDAGVDGKPEAMAGDAASEADSRDARGPDADAAPDAKTDAATAPAPAALVGYDTRTFGPSVTLGKNWQLFSFYGYKGAATQNADGSVLIPGTSSSGISTAVRDTSKPNDWAGVAFGGGAYFEATFSFTGASEDALPTWPAFWANDIETMSQNAVTSQNHWPGQASDYGDWIETDFMEYDARNTTEYGIAMHSWYAIVGSGTTVNTSGISPVSIGSANFASKNRYGFLWVPATSSSQGYAKWFFNDAQVGKTVFWDAYDPSLPPPPVLGTSAFSVLDRRHLAMIFDTGMANPMTIETCSVWQSSAADNLVQ